MTNLLAKFSCLIACSIGALSLCGCDSGVVRCYPTQGTITVQGRPAVGALIMLYPVGASEQVQKMRPYGTTDDQGRFTINGLSQGDGAPAGNYRVTIVWEVAEPSTANMQTDDPESAIAVPDRLGGKYSDPQKSGLQATISAGANELPTYAL